MKGRVLHHGLSSRAWNVLEWTLWKAYGESTMNHVQGTPPWQMKIELQEIAKSRSLSVSELLLRTKGCGPIVLNELQTWLGLPVAVKEHQCVCRRCERHMP